MIDFRVDTNVCIQCGECAADCPAGIIAMGEFPEMADETRCYRCQHCYAVCPTGAVSILGLTPDADARVRASVLTAFVAGRLQRFARSGFRRAPSEQLGACIARML